MTDRAGDVQELARAIVLGDIDRLRELLDRDPTLALEQLPGNPRSMLHLANDWPGHRPNIAEMIRALVAAGADPNAPMPHPDNPNVAETPLHWAASNGDVAAVETLLDVGAEIDAPGGIFDGCTAYEEAVIFEKYEAAQLLHERGAADYLPGVAALGRDGEIADYFDAHGNLRTDVGALPHWTERPSSKMIVDRAFQFACRAGHLAIAQDLHARGGDLADVYPAGRTALQEAQHNGHVAVVEWLQSLDDATNR